ncbi:uncharacterized protein EI97DRAFT_437988 [Westerdykella ornata]|uniref:Uncharacterized protein n=1 Tax=Westerdykella ornata TaxID=318751 RepID=A0A6A6J6M4_WESOR|nr:uncharacterized protein EI97DRAFT_437988 [Westerdykella ornata]KAF2271286.1 hypothetical protein EI97DRAFT_437988 [Westerdykella ornata]
MKLSSFCTAIALALLPLDALAANCYFCERTNGRIGAVSPTYTCGKKCGLDNYDTTFSTYHCWKDGDATKSCYKNCCKKAGRELGVLRGM